MDLVGLLRIVLWRWMIVAPLIILTIVAAFLVWSRVGPSYEASGSLLILGPSTTLDSEETDQRNPYLDLGNLAVPANVLTEVVLGEETRREVVAAGGQPGYQILLDGARGPILVVSAEGSDPDVVSATVDLVMAQLDANFVALQRDAGAPEESFLTLTPVSAPGDAVTLYSSRLRAVFGIAVIGLGFTVMLALAAEAVTRSRRKARVARSLAGVGPSGPEPELLEARDGS